MAEAALALAEIQEVVAAPVPSVPDVMTPGTSAKRIASTIVETERRATEERIKRLRHSASTASDWILIGKGGRQTLEAAIGFISAKINLIEVRLEADKATWAEVLNRIPLPAPLGALRELQHGFERMLSREHDALVEVYYALLAARAEVDGVKGTGEVIRTDEDLEAYFARVRGS
jgi:hypothetical protein